MSPAASSLWQNLNERYPRVPIVWLQGEQCREVRVLVQLQQQVAATTAEAVNALQQFKNECQYLHVPEHAVHGQHQRRSQTTGAPVDKLVLVLTPLPDHQFSPDVTLSRLMTRIRMLMDPVDGTQLSLRQGDQLQPVGTAVKIMVVIIEPADTPTAVLGIVADRLVTEVGGFRLTQGTHAFEAV